MPKMLIIEMLIVYFFMILLLVFGAFLSLYRGGLDQYFIAPVAFIGLVIVARSFKEDFVNA